jgi:oxygen-independent coproporphyrinogen-3 oxidase
MIAEDYGLYLHIPFCLRRCAYCDFFSTQGKRRLLPSYANALICEIEMTGAAGERPPVGSVFIGGGTPSLLDSRQVCALLDAIRRAFRLEPEVEITLEANPGMLDHNRLEGYRQAGINRLSLGVQSADEEELRLLGRIHTVAGAEQTYAAARCAGWTNINLDLIYGLPQQTVPVWERTLERILALEPDHLSLYSLTLERGTELARAVRRGALPVPEEDAAADMYELAEEKLAAAGYRHYEISNWARNGQTGAAIRIAESAKDEITKFPKYACRHNLRYWLNQPYLGLGAGAHGCAANRRYANIRSVEKYIERIRTGRIRRFPLTSAATHSAIRTRDAEMREMMWLGLRLTEAGVDRDKYRLRFGDDYYGQFRKEIDSSIAAGLLEWAPDRNALRLTPRGRLLGNRVFQLFV